MYIHNKQAHKEQQTYKENLYGLNETSNSHLLSVKLDSMQLYSIQHSSVYRCQMMT